MGLMTKAEYQEYLDRLALNNDTYTPQWSEPVYSCPECGSGIRKNLWTCRVLTINPPITEYEYRCMNEKCNHVDWLNG